MSSRSGAESGDCLAPRSASRAELRERGSRFSALLLPAPDEQSVRRALGARRRELNDATHHCWASRIGSAPIERSADAGEPAGTAGLPILRRLRGAGVSDALLVVSRWFGGTKLGKGGLARAYSAVAGEVLEAADLVRRRALVRYQLTAGYERISSVERAVATHGGIVRDREFAARVEMAAELPAAAVDAFEAAIAALGPDVEVGRISARRLP